MWSKLFTNRLNRKSTAIITVIIPDLNNLFFTKLLEAVEAVEAGAMEAGLDVIAQCSHADPAIAALSAETFISMNVDGVLVAHLGDHSDHMVLLRSRLPFVFDADAAETTLRCRFFGINNLKRTGVIAGYLCRVGAPPVFLAMPRITFNAFEREAAHTFHMEKQGHKPQIVWT